MKHVCTHCQQTSEDGNLWCQEIDCPAGKLPALLNYGDFLGDIQVVRLLRVLRAAAIYEARRGKTRCLLKLAHVGDEAYIEREARVLLALQSRRNPFLPQLLPHGAQNTQDPFGQIVFRGQPRAYSLLAYSGGDFLADYLLQNPEPWHRHVGWIILGVASALSDLHAVRLEDGAGRLHLALTPDIVLVSGENPRPLLLDLGLVEKPGGRFSVSDQALLGRYLMPSYTPPELLRGGELTPAADVYGLGLLAYEMLTGGPAYPYRLRDRKDVREQVLTSPLPALGRADLKAVKPPNDADSLVDLVRQAVKHSPTERQSSPAVLYNWLLKVYGLPPQKVPWYRRESLWTATRVAAVSVLVGVILLVLTLALFGGPV